MVKILPEENNTCYLSKKIKAADLIITNVSKIKKKNIWSQMIAWMAVLKTNQYWKRASRGLHKENIPNSSFSHNTGTKSRTDEISKWMNLGFEFFNCCPQNKDPFLFSHLKDDHHKCSLSSFQYRICTCISDHKLHISRKSPC